MSDVSVVIPCYNGMRYLAEAIDSALAQTYLDKEVIVVDDGSTDRSFELMSSYGSRIRIVKQRNMGLSSARNAGIRVSTGRYIAFLDSDDWWSPNFLEELVGAISESAAAIAYCGWQNVGRNGPAGRPFVPLDYEKLPDKTQQLITGVRWPVHAALVRREVLFDAGLFDPDLKCCEDFALWIQAATRNTLVRVPKVLAYYRFHEEQMTRNKALVALSHYAVQTAFLERYPEYRGLLGRDVVRRITIGELLRRGYIAYWARDIVAARKIFRKVMSLRYGTFRDWRYMLPCLLPVAAHAALIRWRDPLSDNTLSKEP